MNLAKSPRTTAAEAEADWLSRTDPLSPERLSELHPHRIEEAAVIRTVLERVQREGLELRLGLSRQVDPETATLVRVEPRELLLRTRNLDPAGRAVLYLNFSLDGRPYFFAAAPREAEGETLLRVGLPSTLYLAERRERMRRPVQRAAEPPVRVSLQGDRGPSVAGHLLDASAEGLAVGLPAAEAGRLPETMQVRFLDGERAGWERRAELRHRLPLHDRSGWVRVGLALRPTPSGGLRIERRQAILERAASGSPSPGALRPEARIVEYRNPAGEPLRAIVDATGDARGALAVVIPPAWGRTKETLLPLAAVILETFRRAELPVVVVRFDGVRKRGESHRDPDCRAAGREHYRFSFSQGVRDIQATLDFLQSSSEFQTSRAVLVSFSASSIEGRRAVLDDGGRRIVGWICVVGAPDLQLPLRVISGGLDYVGGGERQVHFGLQEIQGVVFDVDYMNADLLEHRLGFLEDARRDLAEIRVPITWIHGRHDAWMDADRVRQVLSCGDVRERRLIEVPTGHQLRTSREALQVFQLISGEIGRISLGQELRPAAPDPERLERRRRAERDRLSPPTADFRVFWHDYLLGRDGKLGIELMTAADAYRGLMLRQIDALKLRPGMRVADLGAGTGSFPLELLRRMERPTRLTVDEIDYVTDALRRARRRLDCESARDGLQVHFVSADLDARLGGAGIPLASQGYDAVLASLLLSYLSEPALLLREMFRLLRPGGQLVLSTLRRDADPSKLYVEMLRELRAGRARELFGQQEARRVGDTARRFLNDAARLLDFEEQGSFHFWDPPELARLAREAGFEGVRTELAFGVPPQAVVLSAERT